MSHVQQQPVTIVQLMLMNRQQRLQAVNNLNHQTVRQYIHTLTNVQMGFRPNLDRLRQDNLYETWGDLYTDYVTEDNNVNQDRQLLMLALAYVEVVQKQKKTKSTQQHHNKRGRGRGGGNDKSKRGRGHHHNSHQQHVTTNGNK